MTKLPLNTILSVLSKNCNIGMHRWHTPFIWARQNRKLVRASHEACQDRNNTHRGRAEQDRCTVHVSRFRQVVTGAAQKLPKTYLTQRIHTAELVSHKTGRIEMIVMSLSLVTIHRGVKCWHTIPTQPASCTWSCSKNCGLRLDLYTDGYGGDTYRTFQ